MHISSIYSIVTKILLFFASSCPCDVRVSKSNIKNRDKIATHIESSEQLSKIDTTRQKKIIKECQMQSRVAIMSVLLLQVYVGLLWKNNIWKHNKYWKESLKLIIIIIKFLYQGFLRTSILIRRTMKTNDFYVVIIK